MSQPTVTVAFVLAFLKTLAPGTEKYAQGPVVAAVVEAANGNTEDAALLATWGLYESGLQVEPRAWSSDARKGISCGPWAPSRRASRRRR